MSFRTTVQQFYAELITKNLQEASRNKSLHFFIPNATEGTKYFRAQKYMGLQDNRESRKVAKGFIDQEQHLKATQSKPCWLRTGLTYSSSWHKDIKFSIHKLQKLRVVRNVH